MTRLTAEELRVARELLASDLTNRDIMDRLLEMMPKLIDAVEAMTPVVDAACEAACPPSRNGYCPRRLCMAVETYRNRREP
jgi:hypothetical protein